MKYRVLLSVIALGIGLALPFLQLWLKIVLFALVLLVDADTSGREEKKNYSVSLFFFAGIALSYLYKFFFE